MSTSPEVSKPVVLGVHLSAANAALIRQRARDADRSVSSELRRQLYGCYLPRRADVQPVTSPR